MVKRTSGSCTARVGCEPNNHRLATKHAAVDQLPSQLTWGDIDADLTNRFKRACAIVERMLYAISGSIPLYSQSKQWWHRKHPRCLWIVEQSERHYCGGDPDVHACSDEVWQHDSYHEAAALGQALFPTPCVPVRNRSQDPTRQMLRAAVADRVTFPIGSVSRDAGSQVDYQGRTLFDPLGTGDFGGDPTLIGTDGPDHFDGEDVVVRYTPPATLLAAMIAGSVVLHYNGSTVAAAVAGSTLEATIPAQNHDTTVEWYLAATPKFEFTGASWDDARKRLTKVGAFAGYVWQLGDEVHISAGATTGDYTIGARIDDDTIELLADINGAGGDVGASIDGFVVGATLYEPGGLAAPATKYSYKAFTHYNPYANGLPELWSKCKKGTDGYQFDRSESIQHELINLLRFTLDTIGRKFVHSPEREGAGVNSSTCCIATPIEFRWTGSAHWPQFVAGGKAGVQPLHNLSADLADADPRFSWRGFPFPYGAALGLDNYTYPSAKYDASWLTPLEHVGLPGSGSQLERLHSPQGDFDTCKTYWNSGGRGLQADDVIAAGHLEEICEVVDFLIANGFWVKCAIKRRQSTPIGPFVGGLECGQISINGSTSMLGGPGGLGCVSCWYIADYTDCITWPDPDDWDDCYASSEKEGPDAAMHPWGYGYTPIQQAHEKSCVSYDCLVWDLSSETFAVACGEDAAGFTCLEGDETYCGRVQLNARNHAQPTDYCSDQKCTSKSWGWEAWVCGPLQFPAGCDSMHGNKASFKDRNNHVCPAPDRVRMDHSYGNGYDRTFSCAEVISEGDENLWFRDVRKLRWIGCSEWLGYCDGLCGESYDVGCLDSDDTPGPGGFDGLYDEAGAYLCGDGASCSQIDVGGVVVQASGYRCDAYAPDCNQDWQWCRIDLQLDEDGMPNLGDYDLTPTPGPLESGEANPASEVSEECLCETYGEGSCADA